MKDFEIAVRLETKRALDGMKRFSRALDRANQCVGRLRDALEPIGPLYTYAERMKRRIPRKSRKRVHGRLRAKKDRRKRG